MAATQVTFDEWLGWDCPACDGIGFPIGKLGHLTWYSCRQCGMLFSAVSEGCYLRGAKGGSQDVF